MDLVKLAFRVVTGRCEGGRALTNAAIQFCALVLLLGLPTGAYYVAPVVWDKYQEVKNSLDSIQRAIEVRQAKEDEQNNRLTRLESHQDDQSIRMDRISDRVARIEGRTDGRHR